MVHHFLKLLHFLLLQVILFVLPAFAAALQDVLDFGYGNYREPLGKQEEAGEE
jgi:hypothetical protein